MTMRRGINKHGAEESVMDRQAITVTRSATAASPADVGATVWRALAKASFAVLSHVNAAGEPRSSGVVYAMVDRHLYLAVAPDSQKAQRIASGQRVAVTVPVRRGGLLSLLVPIPPATISFPARAIGAPVGLHRCPRAAGGAREARPGRPAGECLRHRAGA